MKHVKNIYVGLIFIPFRIGISRAKQSKTNEHRKNESFLKTEFSKTRAGARMKGKKKKHGWKQIGKEIEEMETKVVQI